MSDPVTVFQVIVHSTYGWDRVGKPSMEIYSKLQAIVTLLLAVGAIIVTFWAPNSVRWKLLIVFLFVVGAIVAVWLQEQKENREKSRTESAQAELLNWQRGDSKNPPYVGYTTVVDPTSNTSTIQFLVQNPSDFPAYDIGMRLWDIDNLPKEPRSLDELIRQSITNEIISSIAPHTAQLIGRTDVASNINAKRFGAQFTTRAGSFSENLNAQKVNGNWVFATRVTRSDPVGSGEVVFRQVDPLYPLNSKGEVDW